MVPSESRQKKDFPSIIHFHVTLTTSYPSSFRDLWWDRISPKTTDAFRWPSSHNLSSFEINTTNNNFMTIMAPKFPPPCVMGDESIMSPKANGTSAVWVWHFVVPFLAGAKHRGVVQSFSTQQYSIVDIRQWSVALQWSWLAILYQTIGSFC